jgi:hypothetical protein
MTTSFLWEGRLRYFNPTIFSNEVTVPSEESDVTCICAFASTYDCDIWYCNFHSSVIFFLFFALLKDWSQFFFVSWRNKLKQVVHTVRCAQPDCGYLEWTEQIISINSYILIQTFFAMILKNILIFFKIRQIIGNKFK